MPLTPTIQQCTMHIYVQHYCIGNKMKVIIDLYTWDGKDVVSRNHTIKDVCELLSVQRDAVYKAIKHGYRIKGHTVVNKTERPRQLMRCIEQQLNSDNHDTALKMLEKFVTILEDRLGEPQGQADIDVKPLPKQEAPKDTRGWIAKERQITDDEAREWIINNTNKSADIVEKAVACTNKQDYHSVMRTGKLLSELDDRQKYLQTGVK